MAIHAEHIEDSDGNLVAVHYYCSGFCYTEGTGKSAHGHTWPCGEETDYDVYCASCDALLWRGLLTTSGL